MVCGMMTRYENVESVMRQQPPAADNAEKDALEDEGEMVEENESVPGEDPLRHTRKADAQNAKVKKILEEQDRVNDVHIAGQEVRTSDGSHTANYLAIQFEKEAQMTEKLHLFWVNKKLEKMKEGTVLVSCISLHESCLRNEETLAFYMSTRLLSVLSIRAAQWLVLGITHP